MTAALDEIISYVGLNDSDRATLIELHEKLRPHFSAIAQRFYDAIAANPRASSVLQGPEQIARLHPTLETWMSEGLRGPYDDEFYDKRSRVGRRHVEIGLAQRYMFTGMGVLRFEYNARIAAIYPAARAMAVMSSVDKLLDIELTLMLEHYQLDSEERRVARERANLSNRLMALQTLTAGLAHEIRNPLNAAKLQLELLDRRIRRLTSDIKVIEPSELANEEIERLTTLLNEFLTFARAPELHLAEHEVSAIVKHVVDLEQPYARSRGIALSVMASSDRVVARLDAAKVHQVVQNLVRNALEATPPGGSVTVECRFVGRVVRLWVRDSGTGMSSETQRRIFEPFFSTKDNGTGMGMSIVHSLVTMHGGSIDIDTGSTGTTVTISLPQ